MSYYLGKSVYSLSESGAADLLALLLGQSAKNWTDFLLSDRVDGPMGQFGRQIVFRVKTNRRGRPEIRYPEFALAKFIGDRDLLAALRFAARYPRITPEAMLRGSCVATILGSEITAQYCSYILQFHRLRLSEDRGRKNADNDMRVAISVLVPQEIQERHGLCAKPGCPRDDAELFVHARAKLNLDSMQDVHVPTIANLSKVECEPSICLKVETVMEPHVVPGGFPKPAGTTTAEVEGVMALSREIADSAIAC